MNTLIIKSMLLAYGRIDKYIEATDKRIMNCAYASMHNYDIYSTFDNIVDLINEKIVYLNVKNIIDNALGKMDKKDLLLWVYRDKKTQKEIIEKTGVSQSTLNRRFQMQVINLSKMIYKIYSDSELLNIIVGKNIIMNKYKQLVHLSKIKTNNLRGNYGKGI